MRSSKPTLLALTFHVALAAASPAGSPAILRAAEEVTFDASDGVELYADVHVAAEGRAAPVVLLFHQAGGDARGEYRAIVPRLLEAGYSVLAVDLRSGGGRFGGVNRTVEALEGREYGYCDAYPDLEAALDQAEVLGFTGPRIAWGSSYSAALALRLGAERGEELGAVLAFSPASGGPMAACKAAPLIPRLSVPALALRPASEMERESSREQFELFEEHGVRTHIAANAVHGSSMLDRDRVGAEVTETWDVVLEFLAETIPSAGAAGHAPESRVVELELRSEVFDNTRALRVLLPPGYDDPERAQERYPVFYFTDGRAAFDAWGVVETVADLWRRGEIPDYLFVAIDNGGSTAETTDPVRDRASEYLRYEDQTWTGPSPPEPKGAKFPAFLFGEVMPLVDSRFRTDADRARTGLAGDSYAGAAVLYTAAKYPGLLGRILVESPPLHVGDHRLLEELSRAERWPPLVYLGVGTAEIEDEAWRRRIVDNVRALADAIRDRSDGTKVHLEVQEGGVHWYTSWKSRLPLALGFLLSEAPRGDRP